MITKEQFIEVMDRATFIAEYIFQPYAQGNGFDEVVYENGELVAKYSYYYNCGDIDHWEKIIKWEYLSMSNEEIKEELRIEEKRIKQAEEEKKRLEQLKKEQEEAERKKTQEEFEYQKYLQLKEKYGT